MFIDPDGMWAQAVEQEMNWLWGDSGEDPWEDWGEEQISKEQSRTQGSNEIGGDPPDIKEWFSNLMSFFGWGPGNNPKDDVEEARFQEENRKSAKVIGNKIEKLGEAQQTALSVTPMSDALNAVVDIKINGTSDSGFGKNLFTTGVGIASVNPIFRIAKLDVPFSGITAHGVNQAITRGISSSRILTTIRMGEATIAPGRYGVQIRYVYEDTTVVVSATGRNAGKIITVW